MPRLESKRRKAPIPRDEDVRIARFFAGFLIAGATSWFLLGLLTILVWFDSYPRSVALLWHGLALAIGVLGGWLRSRRRP